MMKVAGARPALQAVVRKAAILVSQDEGGLHGLLEYVSSATIRLQRFVRATAATVDKASRLAM